MPPRKRGTFLVPGTPASRKPPPPAAPVGDYSGRNGKRNIVNEFQGEYADRDKLQAALAELSIKHLRPLGRSTLKKYDRTRRLWLTYFEWLYDDVAKARATLAEDAEFPPVKEVKMLVGTLAKNGRSGLQMSRTGWSYHTARSFVLSIHGMRRRHHTAVASRSQTDDLMNYIAKLAKVDKVLTTAKKPKRKLRRCDLMEFTAAVLNPNLNVMNNYIRIEIMAYGCIGFALGIRPSTILEHQDYAGTGEILKWKDLEWLIYGWDEGVGMGIEVFIKFQWMKNMRMDESLFMQSSIRSLDKDKITICAELLLEVMGIHNDIFVQDIIALRQDKAKVLALDLPFKLDIKEHALELPVFTQRRTRPEGFVVRDVDESIVPVASSSAPSKPALTAAQKAKDKRAARKVTTDPSQIQGERYTAPMTTSTMSHLFRKIKEALDFTMKSLRYSYCSDMTGKVSSEHLNYFMGHKPNTTLSHTIYQVPDHHVNNSGLRFDESQDTNTGDFHSSVACGRGTNLLHVRDDVLYSSRTMSLLIKAFKEAEARVFEKFHMSSMDLEDKDDPLIERAQEIWADILRSYAHLATGATLDGDLARPRARSASVSSNMSTTSDPPTSSSSMPRSRSGSDVSMTSSSSRPRSRLVKAESKVILDSDEEVDDADEKDARRQKDPTMDPDFQKKVDALVDNTLSGLSNQHPYLEALASENENPRLLQISLYDALLKADSLQLLGICKICYADPTKSTKDQLRRWTDKLSLHLWKCEDANSPGFWRCPCCGQMVQCGDPDPEDPMTEEELQVVVADLDIHRDICYKKTLVQLGLQPKVEEEEEEDDDDNDDEGDNGDVDEAPFEVEAEEEGESNHKTGNPFVSKSSFGSGYLRLAVSSRMAGARCALRRLFCPICFFASADDKNKKTKREGDTDVRFKIFLNTVILRHHVISHWNNQKRTEVGGIAYDREFKCGFPECRDLPLMKTGKMITHLHNEHDYRFVECSIEHTHSEKCFELPESGFHYITDAQLMHEVNKTPLPTTNLHEYRRPDVQKTQRKKILGNSTDDLALAEESDAVSITAPSIASMDSSYYSEDVSASMSASLSSTSSMPVLTSAATATPESDNVMDIRACMAAFAEAYPNTDNVNAHTALLVDLAIPVSDWGNTKKADLEDIGISWTSRDFLRWKSFATKWAHTHIL